MTEARLQPRGVNWRRLLLRILILANGALAINYLQWRMDGTINVNALWFSIPLLLAELYNIFDSFLFGLMFWRQTERVAPPPQGRESVDVFITTYNEPVELVSLTVEAALAIDWPQLSVYLLDDGARPEMEAMAVELGAGYITRGPEWQDKPLHAKAGNVNNALQETGGEFILMLDADQIPAPEIISSVVGYFRDEGVAFVQTPQYFYNLPPTDPFGSDAPLFYGPIQKGKDGWNAAFFCGSNSVLRREALMQLGLAEFAREIEQELAQGLEMAEADLRDQWWRRARLPGRAPARQALQQARQAYHEGASLEKVSGIIRHGLQESQQEVVADGLADVRQELRQLAEKGDEDARRALTYLIMEDVAVSERLAELSEEHSDLLRPQTKEKLDRIKAAEAQAVMPLATISVTEDMATAMRLHALGWRSIFHGEILAYGLAPEDLGSALGQRLRWAQGTLEVLLRQNPLTIKGLSFAQRMQYFTTIYSYFNGFFNLVLLLAPVVFLLTGIAPLSSWSLDLAVHLLPFLIVNKLVFLYVANGLTVWRGEQYNLALFPLWIQAVLRAIFKRSQGFTVTPKERQTGTYLRLVWPQIAVIALSVVAIVYGFWSLAAGINPQPAGVGINVFWACYNILMLSAIVRAAVYRPPADWDPRPPEFLFASKG